MRSDFFKGFQKQAFILPAAKMVGKGLVAASGGKLNAAANVLGLASDSKTIGEKFKSTYRPGQ